MKKVSSGFITFQGKLLMMHRDKLPAEIDNPDKWGLIGGHQDPGESPEQTMIREAKEEANIDVQNLQLVHQKVYLTDRGEEKEYSFFHIPLSDEQASQVRLMDEGQAIEFKSLEEMQNLELTSTLKQFFSDDKNNHLLHKILE